MKISRPESIAVLLTVAALSFTLGWFLRGGAAAQPVIVETQYIPAAAGAVVSVSLPTGAPIPSQTPAPPAELQPGEAVNINTADLETLQKLPGIGEKRAMDIIAYREKNGPFRIPEDITAVRGIGEGLLKNMIDYITTEDSA